MIDRVVYVAGPMTGLPEYNYPAFFAAAELLTARGYTVVNPAECGVRDGWSHGDYLRYGLTRLLTCDQVAMLPGWAGSTGARLEWDVAHALGMQVYAFAELVDPPPAT